MQNALLLLHKKSGYYSKKPTKWPNVVFIQIVPILLQKKQLLLPISPKNDQIVYLFETPPHTLKTSGFYEKKSPQNDQI